MKHICARERTFILALSMLMAGACQMPSETNSVAVNSAQNNTNLPVVNANGRSPAQNEMTTIEASEPTQYQGTMRLAFEAIGGQSNASLPAITALVARSSDDRVMAFTLPNNERVIYLDKGSDNYLILPSRKQYAQLDKETLGFEIRRLMMPEQIVQQIKNLQGVQFVGEETLNGRAVNRYAYSGAAETQTRAGKVSTDASVIVDKETGLPLRSETLSKSESGGEVQSFQGIRIVTEMTDIQTVADPSLFMLPAEYSKIDPEQVKGQVNLVFNAVAAVVGQMMKQSQISSTPPPSGN